MLFLGSKYAKIAFAADAPSRTPLGELKRSPDTLAAIYGLTSKGRVWEGRGEKGKVRKGRREEGRK